MLESKQLWFGRLAEMNDTAEVDHYLDGVGGAVADLFPEVPKSMIEQLVVQMRAPLREQTFISSWCEHIDPEGELPMWSLYAKEDDGVGIVVDARQFQSSNLKPQSLSFFLNVTRVEYAKSVDVPSIAARMVRQLSTLGSIPPEQRAGLVPLLLAKAIAVKHHSYASEKEVRFLSTGGIDEALSAFVNMGRAIPGDVERRTMGGRTYLAVPLRLYDVQDFDLSIERVLQKIIVAPGGDQRFRTEAVQELLAAHGLSSVAVKRNEIPFR